MSLQFKENEIFFKSSCVLWVEYWGNWKKIFKQNSDSWKIDLEIPKLEIFASHVCFICDDLCGN